MRLGGKQEFCPSCQETFSCTRAGDMHRVGDHAISVGPDRRRCLSAEEMTARGMAQNARGVWMTPGREAESSRSGIPVTT